VRERNASCADSRLPRQRVGRPTDYTPELAQRVCDLVASGSNLNLIGRMRGYPGQETLYRWLKEKSEFREKYSVARALRAHARSDRIDEYVRRLLRGDLDPAAANVAITAERWQAGRESPKAFGDRLDHNHSGEVAQQVRFIIDGRDLLAPDAHTGYERQASVEHRTDKGREAEL